MFLPENGCLAEGFFSFSGKNFQVIVSMSEKYGCKNLMQKYITSQPTHVQYMP